VTAVAVRPDGRSLASAGADGAVILWDLATSQEVRRYPGPTKAIARLAFSPNGSQLAAGGDDRTARVWDVDSGRLLHEFRHEGPVASVAFQPDGKVLVCGTRDDIFFWELGTEKCLPRPVPLQGTGLYAGLAYDHDGRTLVTGGHADRRLRFWNLTA